MSGFDGFLQLDGPMDSLHCRGKVYGDPLSISR